MAKLTIKQENFCLKYVESGNASEAYRHAYDAQNMKETTINRNAKALLDNSKIATRVKELQKPIQEKHNITVESILKELEQARVLALTADYNGKTQTSAAVSASMGKAKLAGLLIEKQQVEHAGVVETNSNINLSKLSQAQLVALAAINVKED